MGKNDFRGYLVQSLETSQLSDPGQESSVMGQPQVGVAIVQREGDKVIFLEVIQRLTLPFPVGEFAAIKGEIIK